MNEKIIPIGSSDFAVVRSDARMPRTTPTDKGETLDAAKPSTSGKVTVHPNPGNLGTVAQEKR
jgi:hypothetical protein